MWKNWSVTAAVGLRLVGGAGGASAQGLEIELTPMVGGQLFLADLPGTFSLTSEAGTPVTFEGAEIDDALAVGGRAGIRLTERLGVGATVLYSPTTLTEASGAESDLGIWHVAARGTESRGPAPEGPATAGTPTARAAPLPGLLAVMSGLERDVARVSRGLWRADYDTIAAAAHSVATHPEVPPSEAQRIAGILGPT